jgi:Mn-dependent DtxR family transcriptional regulator
MFRILTYLFLKAKLVGMAPRYKVTLTEEERSELETITRHGKTTAPKFIQARALLLCDAGEHGPAWKVADIAEALGITPRTIEHLKQRFVEEGFESALVRKPSSRIPEVTFNGAEKVRLVMDNLSTHNLASLYEAFEPEEVRRLARRLEIHHTPKHGSWLNIAEIELSALKIQCMDRRIPEIGKLRSEVAAWESDRNNRIAAVDWQFSTADARIKLKRLYPKL